MSVARAGAEGGTAWSRPGQVIDRGSAVRGAVIAGLLVIALLVLPEAGPDWTTTFTSVAIYAVVAAGLGILYGRVGMISLGQIAILALGTWIGARLAFASSLPFPVLLLFTGLITGFIGVIVGLPALRLSGLHLALVTLMFAGAVKVILDNTNFPNGGPGFLGYIPPGGLEPIQPVRRPDWATGDAAYYRYTVVVCALMFALALLHIAGKPGRAWAAIRESEPGALAAGVNVTLYKLWAFGLASFMTGVVGCLLASLQKNPTTYGFGTQDSLTIAATSLIGGVYSLWGAVVAGLFAQLVPCLFQAQWNIDVNFVYVIFGAGLLQVLLTAPGGLVQQFPKDMVNLGRGVMGLGRRLAARRQTA